MTPSPAPLSQQPSASLSAGEVRPPTKPFRNPGLVHRLPRARGAMEGSHVSSFHVRSKPTISLISNFPLDPSQNQQDPKKKEEQERGQIQINVNPRPLPLLAVVISKRRLSRHSLGTSRRSAHARLTRSLKVSVQRYSSKDQL